MDSTVILVTNPTGTTFTSLDSKIATVNDSGTVTGKKVGNTVIEITTEGYEKLSIPVGVIEKAIIGNITCDATTITDLQVDSTIPLVTNPTGVSFKSLDTAIATVSAGGVVTGVKDGSTTICIEKDRYNKLDVPATVINKVVPVLTVTPTDVNVETGEAITLEVKVDGVTKPIKDVELATDKNNIVLIEQGANIIKAGSVGTATITVSYQNAVPVIVDVEVVAPPVKVPVIIVDPTEISVSTGDAITFEVKVDNEVVAITDVKLTTDDSSIVLITPDTNEMLAGNVGTAIVTVTYENAVPVIVNVEITDAEEV